MTEFQNLNAIIRTTAVVILGVASIAFPQIAAADEISILSAETKAAATAAVDMINDELLAEITVSIRPLAPTQADSTVTVSEMEKVVKEGQVMSSSSTDLSGGNDT